MARTMGRHRKRNVTGDGVPHPRKEEKPSVPGRKEKKKKTSTMDIGKFLINVSIGLCVFSLVWFFYALYMRSSLARRVVTLHPSPRVLDTNSTSAGVSPERFWGSYRPQVYFGMKTRSPRSVVTGLMWMRQFSDGDVSLRHTCEQSDRLPGYGWLMHDGLSFGVQEIHDRDFTLTTEFAKRMGGSHGGDWTWRVTAKQHSSAPYPPVVSLMFYVATDTQGSLRAHVEDRTRLSSVTGTSEELGNFKITFRRPTAGEAASGKYASYNYLQTLSPGLDKLTDIVRSSLNPRFVFSPPSGEKRVYIAVDTYNPPPQPQQQKDSRIESDFIVHQVTVQTPFQIEVLFESGSFRDRPNQLAGLVLTEELAVRKAVFDDKFERTFRLQAKRVTPGQVKFGKAALSNMLGGIGYFFGQSIVQSAYNEHPLLYPEGALFTAVPSRSFFPRGFLWDEGFHQLLLSKWDPQGTREAVAHWLDLINVEGWIPREQILGDEARSKVPSEFMVQRNENANPPTLFLVLDKLVGQLESHPDAPSSRDTLAFLRKLYPRLQTWFEWYNTTQAGPLPNSYRWRGRDTDTNLFLNPKTLTSGLDDYPRASHPSTDERHVDLYCWMALASGTMASVARLLGEPRQEYERTHLTLTDNRLLSELHWSEHLRVFCDYGNHTHTVQLQQEKVFVPPGQPRHQFPVARLVRAVRKAPRLQFVNALGYRNTEHDAPYWRGAIWININYLAIRALHHYSTKEGPYRDMAIVLYQELRTNIINNVYKQYQDTGYIWEQYNDSTGRGQGSHPFTGWSALVVLIMAEEY
uniref:Mannosyl-oligosaccharide glucosidase n=2 Tax=Electrophorus electricus TaxID=8005 RepID=A0A4W4FL06_ELEEL